MLKCQSCSKVLPVEGDIWLTTTPSLRDLRRLSRHNAQGIGYLESSRIVSAFCGVFDFGLGVSDLWCSTGS